MLKQKYCHVIIIFIQFKKKNLVYITFVKESQAIKTV
jgi:hypothetical protein